VRGAGLRPAEAEGGAAGRRGLVEIHPRHGRGDSEAEGSVARVAAGRRRDCGARPADTASGLPAASAAGEAAGLGGHAGAGRASGQRRSSLIRTTQNRPKKRQSLTWAGAVAPFWPDDRTNSADWIESRRSR